MSLERNRWGFDGEITFVCDECGHEEHTDTASFDAAKDHIKAEGWSIRKDGSEWMHFCGDECLKKWKENNSQHGVGA
jgi:hypothetical protein